MKTVSAKNLMCTIAVNVNNPLLTDEQFREFVRNRAGICQEVLEWREAMAQLGEDFSKHQLCPPCQECGGDGAGGEHEDDCVMGQSQTK